MGNPPDAQFNVAPVRVDESIRIFNLTVTCLDVELILQLYEEEKASRDDVIEITKLWLLSVTSSYVGRSRDRKFKSEYIIPQMIMLSAHQLKLDGVAYLSKRVKNDGPTNYATVNLGLFEDYHGEKKISSNCMSIEVGPSVNYGMYKQLLHSATYQLGSTQLHLKSCGYTPFISMNGSCIAYDETELFNFDRYLFSDNMIKK